MSETIDYNIIAFDEVTARITVAFAGALYPILLELPVAEDGSVPDGEVLDKWIKDRTPLDLIERKKLLVNGIPNAEKIKELVKPIVAPPTPIPQEEIDAGWKTNIQGAVLMILRETGVIAE